MGTTKRRRLPVGIQSFKSIREGGYVYVDKTDIIWELANYGDRYNYLSRPRRFGKSILVDTLQCYFEGRKELFEGLKIMELEQEWKQHPVIRLDMSEAGASAASLNAYFHSVFGKYEQTYGITPQQVTSLAVRFKDIILSAFQKTGMPVVVLIDEYDSPLQHSWQTPEHEACTAVYREVFAILKSADQYERFVFITSITKFTQISLFSVLNNLSNISFDPEYAPLCGITEQEISENFQPELERMAEVNGWTMQETHDRLKDYYDGYHFCEDNMVDIYNPYSLINALTQSKVRSFWASSGATSLLPKFVKDAEVRMGDFEDCVVLRSTLETSDVTGGGAELFLYQTGYLTIKSSDEFGYVLGFPNEEVRQALYEVVLPALTLRAQGDIQSLQAGLLRQLGTGKVDDAMRSLKALIADVPYSNKKLASMDMEERYRLIISTILNAIGMRVEVEKMIATGRIDLVARVSRFTYVMELKLQNNGGKEAAARQILDRQYLAPFQAQGRQVVGLAIELQDEGKGLLDWKVIVSTPDTPVDGTDKGNGKIANEASSTEVTEEEHEISNSTLALSKPFSTEISQEDWDNAITDEYGALYSQDGKRLFKGPDGMHKYTIKDGTIVICDCAFWLDNVNRFQKLQMIEIPESVEIIGKAVFNECDNVSELTLPESLLEIKGNPFVGWHGKLKVKSPYFTYEEGILYNRSKNLLIACNPHTTHINIPSSVTSIGNAAFMECNRLTKITLPENLREMTGNPFAGWHGRLEVKSPHFTIDGGILYNEDKSIVITCCSDATRLTISDNVSTIRDSAFSGCKNITEIVLPQGLTTIGDSAFSYCESLTKITLPQGLTTIGNSAFEGCKSITEIVLPQGLTTIGDSAFSYCESLTKITLPQGLTTIGNSAFEGCKSITKIILPESLREIIGNPFQNWHGKVEVKSPYFVYEEGILYNKGKSLIIACHPYTKCIDIPGSVTIIGDSAFYGCKNLKEITLPQGVITVGDSAFYGCDNLTEIILPQGLTTIGKSAFYKCKKLSKITLPQGLTVIGDYVFNGCDKLSMITLPQGTTTIGRLGILRMQKPQRNHTTTRTNCNWRLCIRWMQ